MTWTDCCSTRSGLCEQSWNYAGNLLGFGNLGEHIYHTIGMNRGGREIYFREHVDADFPMERFNEVTRARYYEILEQTGIPMKPGAKELLRAAKEKGLRIALATSSSRDRRGSDAGALRSCAVF